MHDNMEISRWPNLATLEAAPTDWEVLTLYMTGKIANKLYSHPPALWVPWRQGIMHTGAYVINRSGMQKV